MLELLIPDPIEKQLEKLNIIVCKFPQYIPVDIVATFLGAKKEGLRVCIENGHCPFGLVWQSKVPTFNAQGEKIGMHTGRKAYKIPTVTFYLWYTQGAGFK
ncbi:MAG: hypothetical protein WAX04_06570 [Oscillospiraceae bacterium]